MTEDFLSRIARGAGLAPGPVVTASRTPNSVPLLRQATAESQRLGITSTPTFLLGRRVARSADPLEPRGVPSSPGRSTTPCSHDRGPAQGRRGAGGAARPRRQRAPTPTSITPESSRSARVGRGAKVQSSSYADVAGAPVACWA